MSIISIGDYMLNPVGSRIIKTSRTLLRPFSYEDILPMFYGYAGKKEVTKYLNWSNYNHIEQAQYAITSFIHSYTNPFYFNWAIIDKATFNLIGSISIHHVDSNDDNGELGICIDSAYWNKGIGYEVLKEIINFGFKTVGFHRLTARVHEHNIGSNKLMKKLNMNYEGTNIEAFKKDQKYYNLNLYSIINQF